MASSMAAKIRSPLSSTSIRFPSVAATPMTPSSVRRIRVAASRDSGPAAPGVRGRHHEAIPNAARSRSCAAASGSDSATLVVVLRRRGTGPDGFELRGDRGAVEDRDRREERPDQEGDHSGQRSVGLRRTTS